MHEIERAARPCVEAQSGKVERGCEATDSTTIIPGAGVIVNALRKFLRGRGCL